MSSFDAAATRRAVTTDTTETRPWHGAIPNAAADGAAWAGAEELTHVSREQLQIMLAQPDTLSRMHERFANLGEPQQAGHMFEWQQELTFNLDAVAKHVEVRAEVTEWIGQSHAPADLRLVDAHGHVLSEVQTKVVESTSHRLGSVDGLAADRYHDMQLVVPADHLATAESLLDRRLAMPSGLWHDRYIDVRGRLDDHIDYRGVSSEAVSRHELIAVTQDPDGYLDRLIDHNVLDQFLLAGEAGLSSGLLRAAVLLAAAAGGESSTGLPWAQAGLAGARGALRSAVVTVEGQAISLAAQHAVADGAGAVAGALAGALAEGVLPFALARGVLDIGVAAHGFATGRLSAGAAAEATAQAVVRNGAVWACATVGQVVIPVPIVGSVVGAVVGQLGTAMIVKGVQLAVLGRDRSAQWDAAYELLLAQTAQIQAVAAVDLDRLRSTADLEATAFGVRVLPALSELSAIVGHGQSDDVLARLAHLTRCYARAPLFTSTMEFERFMTNPETMLVLDLGSR